MPNIGLVSAMVAGALRNASADTNVTATELAQRLLIANEAASLGMPNGNATMRTQVLSLLQSLTQSQAVLNPEAAAGIVESLGFLVSNLTSAQAGTLLNIAALVANRTLEMDEHTGSELLSIIQAATQRVNSAGT